MALLARQLYFEAVKNGDELPPLVKPPVDRVQIARYAGAAFDFNPLSVDEHHARNSGFPAPHVHATMVMGFLAELAVDWLRGARIRRFSARFVKIVFPGDVLTCRGRVVDRRFEPNGVYTVDIEVWAENQRGELSARGLVTAQLYYSAEDESRQRSGQPALVVTPEQEAAALAKLSRAQAPRRPEPVPPPPPPPKPKAPAAPKAAPPAAAKAVAPAGKGAAPAAKVAAAAPPPLKPAVQPKPPMPLKPVLAPLALGARAGAPAKGPAKPAASPKAAVATRPPTVAPKAPAIPARPAGRAGTETRPLPISPTERKAVAKPAVVARPAAAVRPVAATKPPSAAATKKPLAMAARRPPHKVGKVRSDVPQKAITKVRDAVRKLKAAVRPSPKSKTATRSSRQRPGSKPSPKKRR